MYFLICGRNLTIKEIPTIAATLQHCLKNFDFDFSIEKKVCLFADGCGG